MLELKAAVALSLRSDERGRAGGCEGGEGGEGGGGNEGGDSGEGGGKGVGGGGGEGGGEGSDGGDGGDGGGDRQAVRQMAFDRDSPCPVPWVLK